MKKILTVFGTRPEAITMAPLILALEEESSFETVICVTGQQREMLDQVLETFEIIPDYNLDIMKERQTLTEITASILNEMSILLAEEAPDLVLVHGDTSTTFATALACLDRKSVV